MLIAYLFVGCLIGALAAVAGAVAGLPIWAAFALYSVCGSLGLVGAAVLARPWHRIELQHAPSRESAA